MVINRGGQPIAERIAVRPLSILFCISWFWPVESGAERQARRQARELVRRGHRVQVLTRAIAGAPREEVVDGIRILRWVQPLEVGPLFGVSFLYGMRSALKRLRHTFDLVHCHQSLWEAAAVGWARPRILRPSVVQPASSGPYGEYQQWRQTRGRSLLKRWILRNDRFVAISDELRSELLEFGVPAERIQVIGSGIDVDEFSPGPSPLERTLPPRPRVVFTGRLHPQKNLDTLLRAWQEVMREVRATLILVGDGPERSTLEQLATRLGISSTVLFVGHQQDVLPYLRAADVFVLPSSAEGMSNSLLEAMAVGLPPVVSRIGGNVDLVQENRTGLLIEPDRPATLTAALVRLLKDPSLRQRLGAAARQYVKTKYSLQSVVDRYESLYAEVLQASTAH